MHESSYNNVYILDYQDDAATFISSRGTRVKLVNVVLQTCKP